MTSATPAIMTGGEAVVRTLLSNGVRRLFGLPGVQNDWLFNALYDHRDTIDVLHTRHEQGAAFMALGAALATGELAVCSVVPGPGTLNAGAALATAHALNAPLLFLTGQIPLPLIGRGTGVLHEITDQLGLLRGLTKLALRVEHPTAVEAAVNSAIDAIRSGRPRPAAIEIPMDVLAERAPVNEIRPRARAVETVPVDEEQLGRIAETLVDARAPMIFVGLGAQAVAPQVRLLAERLRAPVVAYRTGRGIMDSRSPLSFVMPAARPLWARCDVALALGTTMRLPLQSWEWQPEQKLMRIDIDPASHSLLRKPTLALTARLEDALPALTRNLASTSARSQWQHSQMIEAQESWRVRAAVLEPQIRYLEVIRTALGEDGIFVDELTQVGFASRLMLPVYHPRTFISTGYMGTLGYGFPTALGVKVARPHVPVVSVTGDGGFMFAVGELATAVQHGISLAIVLFNNGQYGNVQQMQRSLYGGRVIASDLVNPDFVALAKAFGARGCRVTEPEQLQAQLQSAFAAKGPTLIEVPVGDMPSVDQFR
jgi:acetolactate synthase I/II/III large subunit